MCLDRERLCVCTKFIQENQPNGLHADTPKEKRKLKEGDNMVQEAPADVPSLLELKRIYYELMIRYAVLLSVS